MNVVCSGVPTSQLIAMILVALALLGLIALLWKNHRAFVPRQSDVLLPTEAETLWLLDSIAWFLQAVSLPVPARAPTVCIPVPIAASISRRQCAQTMRCLNC